MTNIKSIKGVLYSPEAINDISRVVAPPYDVISPQMQEDLYDKHPNNVIRLILGKINPDDSENNNRYTRSATFFGSWLKDNILTQDDAPSIYVYRQEYSFQGVHKTRTGFIAGYQLEDFGEGNIRPHENTLAKPKEDRLKLTKACGANFSPIFGLYSDPGDSILQSFESSLSEPPLIDFTDNVENRHSVWRVSDKDIVESTIQAMKDKNILIADGHHRYETAVNYRNEMRDKKSDYTGEEGFNYVMMYLTNTDSDGLSVFAIHRVVNGITDFNYEKFITKISDYFTKETIAVKDYSSDEQAREHLLNKMKEMDEKKHVFGLYSGSDYIMLTLKDIGVMDRLASSDNSNAWKNLDISILHTIIIEDVLGISKENMRDQKNITYRVDDNVAVTAVKSGNAQLAFFLNPTLIKGIQDVVASGEKMPQKSTFFYPKLMSGLVINKLD